MFRNYMNVAIRNLLRHRGYSLINITGLAIGMACCILLLLWVQDELSVDQFHENANDLYVVVTRAHFGTDTITWPGTPPAFSGAVKEEYPEILNAARIQNGTTSLVLTYGEKKFREEVQLADASVLEMFTFPLIEGDRATALSDPHSIVMTERMAETYFGDEDPVGKTLLIENTYDFTVTGVLENLPRNSTIQFDCLVPLEFLKDLRGKEYLDTWGNLSFRTYVLLQQDIPFEQVSAKLADRLIKEGQENVEVFLRPFDRLYLYWLDLGGGRIELVRLFALIALLVLLIACINFMNLTTARSGNRATEIGMRKVAGACRIDIIKQFYGESIVPAFLSSLLAVGLVVLLLPAFNHLVGKEVTLDFYANPALSLGLIGVSLCTGVVAGSYPALFMASFQPVKTLKGSVHFGSKSSRFRKILVVMQFAISITLITGTLVVYQQLEFMRNRDLGFDKEHLVYIPVDGTLKNNYEAAKQSLLQYPNIVSATVSSHSPTGVYWNGSGWDWDGRDPEINPLVTYLNVDADFAETFRIKMTQGQFFSRERIESASGSVIINEEFARIMGKESPVGARLTNGDNNLLIIGVIQDFHFKPLRTEIGPLMMVSGSDRYRYMFLRITPDDIARTIEHIEQVHKQFNPDFPFEYTFLDEDFARLYGSEQQFGSIIRYFTALTIIIACLGLFGLASFMSEQRTKEIGIRKVLGSSVPGVILLLSKEFMQWVAIANVVAWPIAWYILNNWLQDFTYRISLEWETFMISGLITVGIAMVTVGYQAIKAASDNPVDALRYE